ncbi:predicted kinase [Hoeflea halophila]|uniref:Predicted kinase n=1 Tax=Hoeflea halophila TaxID=714899 RepID=A0A286IDB5_9HYPH|nr:ATP-binding protein [Hoeflea halophila]SOE18062.1 predicted kinase [Hoeflea halophila]
MLSTSPALHLVCGKIASGKSTLTAKLGAMPGTVVIAEDDWLAALYSDEMSSISDYVRCSAKLQAIMGPHIVSLLTAGVSVALDYPANTVANRLWMRAIIDVTDVAHKLHFLDVPDDVCKARMRARNEGGDHPFAVSDEQFEKISKHFVAPTPQEGFNIVTHRPDDQA